MIARYLVAAKIDASRYPLREVAEEREINGVEDAIEEIVPLPGSWLVVEATDRALHFAEKNGRWDFRQLVVFPVEVPDA